MYPMKEREWTLQGLCGKPITEMEKKKKKEVSKVQECVQQARAESGFGTGVGQEENLEKERGTTIFFLSPFFFKSVYEDRKGEKNSGKISCAVKKLCSQLFCI